MDRNLLYLVVTLAACVFRQFVLVCVNHVNSKEKVNNYKEESASR